MSPQAAPAGWTVVHDFAFVLAGAERVTAALANHVVPGAPVLVLGADDDVVSSMGLQGRVTRRLPRSLGPRSYRLLTGVLPQLTAFGGPVEGDMLCSSYAFAHHVRATGRTVVYCHSPLRQIWSGRELYASQAGRVERAAVRALGPVLRKQDVRAARRADVYVASSRAVRDRIATYYGRRDVPVISPPVDTALFQPGPSGMDREYYLWAGRIIEPYKRLAMTLEAFRGLPHRLLVAGEGRDRDRLERTAPPNVTFLGWQDAAALAELYRGARAVVFPSEDDFGLVPVEAMSCGTPAVAYRGGGAAETLVEGGTGVFFFEQTPAALRRAVVELESRDWDDREVAAHAEPYGLGAFVSSMREVLADISGGTTVPTPIRAGRGRLSALSTWRIAREP